MKDYGNVDSKYRFVIIAAKRAKELLKGSKPRFKSKSRNPIRIAQSEVKLGLVDFEVLPTLKEEPPEVEERVFLGEQAGGVFEEEHEEAAVEEVKPEAPATEEVEEIGVDFTDEFEPLAGAEVEEKEEEEAEGAAEEDEEAEGGEEEEES